MSKLQWLQSKFIRLALHLPKYISVKLLHDSSGLPYVKDRLLSLVQLGLEKDFQESFSKGVDNIQQGQPCVGSFSNTALCNPSGQFLG